MTCQIPLTQGYAAVVDDDDADLASVSWHAYSKGETTYAKRSEYRQGQSPRSVRMHRVILARKLGRDLLPTEQADHEDGDGLNNRRSNLRLATHAQNVRNRRRPNRNNQQGLRGVGLLTGPRPGSKPYIATIQVDGLRQFLGCYHSAEEAHEAYRQATVSQFGEFSAYRAATESEAI